MDEKSKTQFSGCGELYNLICQLRDPEKGCPWDLKQTTNTLRKDLLEETYECIDAIDKKNDENLQEELGDLALLLMLLIRIKEQEGAFSADDVFNGICEKLIRRHPHIFGEDTTRDISQIVKNWDYIKENLEGKKPQASILEHIPSALPPLEKANALQKKAAKVGFEWDTLPPVFEKLDEEIGELKTELTKDDRDRIEAELGDVLFTVVNISRMLKIDPSLALNRTNQKFVRRFQEIEEVLKKRKLDIKTVGVKVMDTIWDEIKAREKTEEK